MIDAFRLLPDGTVVGLYTDTIDLRLLGHVWATRASWVEWDEAAQAWVAILRESGKRLGPFRTRVNAVSAERRALARRLAAGSFRRSLVNSAPLPATSRGPLPADRRPRTRRLSRLTSTSRAGTLACGRSTYDPPTCRVDLQRLRGAPRRRPTL